MLLLFVSNRGLWTASVLSRRSCNDLAERFFLGSSDKWGNSGVMTFMVNQQGRVYEKNLGPDTAKIAPSISAYDPGSDLEARSANTIILGSNFNNGEEAEEGK